MFKILSKRFMAAPCRLLTLEQQQRTIVKATIPPLKNTPRPEQWTKTSLKRLRKNELEDLAREHRMSTAGTKLDLVQRLLQSRTSSTSWPSENTLDHRVEEAIAKHHSYQKNESDTKQTPLNTIEQEFQESVTNVSAVPAVKKTTNSSISPDKTVDNAKEELDAANWVQAFELKASHSHLRKPSSKIRFGSASKEAFPPATATLDHDPSSPVLLHMQDELGSEKKTEKEDVPEDVNKVWVKAFEQKASSRRTRRQMLDTDTFSSRDAETTGLEFINSPFTPSYTTAESPLLHDQVSSASVENKVTGEKSSTHGSVGSARNWFINSMIGTGLLIWVAGGEDGFKYLADLLMKSS